MLRFRTVLFFIFACLSLCTLACQREATNNTTSRANVLVIISDDQRLDQMNGEFMPAVQSEIFDKGCSFMSAYVTSPACCPSRSAIMTGKYNSRNKVYGNRYPLAADQLTLAQILKEKGYYTGLIGKYLNSWDGTPRPEYDFWFSHRGAMVSYNNPVINYNGVEKEFKGYVSHVYRDKTLEFIDKASKSQKPFFLFYTPNAPHEPAIPEEKYKNIYQDLTAPRTASFNTRDQSKPEHVSSGKKLTPKKIEAIDEFYRDQLRTLKSIDESIESLLEHLKAKDLLKNTIVVFISDNGVFMGEFRLKGKSKVYEPAIHVPMAIRYDAADIKTKSSSALVANIDIAPTIIDLIEPKASFDFDGKSLKPILLGKKKNVRNNLLIESWGNRRKRGNKGFIALHSGQTVYIENEDDVNEYYDLVKDPEQLHNLATSLDGSKDLSKQRMLLHNLVKRLRGSVTFEVDADEVPGFGGAEELDH